MAHLEEHMAIRLLESEQNAQVRARCSKLRAAQRRKHSREDRAWAHTITVRRLQLRSRLIQSSDGFTSTELAASRRTQPNDDPKCRGRHELSDSCLAHHGATCAWPIQIRRRIVNSNLVLATLRHGERLSPDRERPRSIAS
jgi:hypothetical protein